MYLAIYVTGLVINTVQGIQKNTRVETTSLFTFIHNSELLYPIIFLGVILVSTVILGRFNWFYRSKWNQSLRYANRREINEHRATLDIACFRSKEHDDLSKRIEELPTSWQTRIWFADEMFNLFTTLISFALFGASLLWYAPIYAFVLIVSALPIAIVEFHSVSMWWNLFQELVPRHKKRNMLEKPYHDKIAFMQALMFNQMPVLRREIDNNTDSIMSDYDKLREVVVKREIITHIIAVVGLYGVIVHAIVSTVINMGEVGTLTIVIAAARTFQGNLEAVVSTVAEQWNSAKGVILIEKEFLGLKPVIQTPSSVAITFKSAPCIRFDRVSFAYPDTESLVLREVSFKIEPGSKVAIVGKSGSGKSTIQALLMRHYDPNSGAIYAGDINLQNIEPKRWSNVASALTQEYSILERTIEEEIASSRFDQPINQEEVVRSAQFANFDEVTISDPRGYGSQIGIEFGGRDFSGGEKQRLALARVHYRGTPIIILDEPDAKLDPKSAQKVIDEVFALRGVTVIIITHHVSRAERCDKIIVMETGEVAEQGTHQELLSLQGTYAEMNNEDRKRLGLDYNS